MSPLAKMMLRTVPQAYNPEPEIFVERTIHRDLTHQVDPDRVIVFSTEDGVPRKALAHGQHHVADSEICGPGGRLAEYTVSDAGQGWRYMNGPFRCSY
jgi:hypothetical protein